MQQTMPELLWLKPSDSGDTAILQSSLICVFMKFGKIWKTSIVFPSSKLLQADQRGVQPPPELISVQATWRFRSSPRHSPARISSGWVHSLSVQLEVFTAVAWMQKALVAKYAKRLRLSHVLWTLVSSLRLAKMPLIFQDGGMKIQNRVTPGFFHPYHHSAFLPHLHLSKLV